MALNHKEVAPETADAAAHRKPAGMDRRAFLGGESSTLAAANPRGAAGPVVIGPSCLALNRIVCRSCAERCVKHAIHFHLAPGGIAVPLVRAERCDVCGECIAVCPTSAIVLETDLVNEEAA
jgi:ferredoxin